MAAVRGKLPAVNANHHDARHIEADTTGYDGICWRQVERARWILASVIFVH